MRDSGEIPDAVTRNSLAARKPDATGPNDASNEVVVAVPSGAPPAVPACNTAPNPPQNLPGSALGTIVMLDRAAPSARCAASQYVAHAGSSPGLSNLAIANMGPV
jgi:hypothetical protein